MKFSVGFEKDKPMLTNQSIKGRMRHQGQKWVCGLLLIKQLRDMACSIIKRLFSMPHAHCVILEHHGSNKEERRSFDFNQKSCHQGCEHRALLPKYSGAAEPVLGVQLGPERRTAGGIRDSQACAQNRDSQAPCLCRPGSQTHASWSILTIYKVPLPCL